MQTDVLQTAIYNRLITDAVLVAALSQSWGLAAVFSDVPEINGDNNAFYPYISLGPEIASPFDTDGTEGASVTVQIDVWSRQSDFMQCKAIASLVHARLHRQPLTIAGAHWIDTQAQPMTQTLDPDGRTRHGILQFTVTYDDI